ncbi:MAG: hypothetical protein PHD37_06435 [Gallionellaceae bacterium]|nr:hypothetical protein [Gallionellaceae bacterium]
MKFNKDQREGLAKVADNLATACMITAIVGGLVDQKIGWVTAMLLLAMFVVLLSVAYILRFEKGGSNGN